MRWVYSSSLLLVLGLLFSFPSTALAQDSLSEANRLYKEATTGDVDMEKLKQSVELYQEVTQEQPENYEAWWKGARASREYADKSRIREKENWEDIAVEYGQLGMEMAQEAIELNPQGVEGHYFYGVSVGSYSDGVSVVTAWREGLSDKTHEHLTRAYEIDKEYNDATPPMALGRYFEVLPWIAGQDKDKALDYYREALELMPEDSPHRPNLHVWAGRLMLDMGEEEERARNLLGMAAESEHDYYSSRAQEILDEYS